MREDYEKAKKDFIDSMNKTYASKPWWKRLLLGWNFSLDRYEEKIFRAGYYSGKYIGKQEYDERLDKVLQKLKNP